MKPWNFAFLCCTLNTVTICGWWHLYEDRDVAAGCPVVGNTSNPVDEKEIAPLSTREAQLWKLWPGLWDRDDVQKGEVVYGFRKMMDAVWRNQHPPDCKAAKFLIPMGWDQGFGSEIHVAGVGLAFAMKLNRVYVMNPEGPRIGKDRSNRWQVENHFCKKQGVKTLDCYFEPWSNCSLRDSLGYEINITQLQGRQETYISEIEFLQGQGMGSEAERVILLNTRGDVRDIVPEVVESVIPCSPISPSHAFYLWRTVSAAFMLRPNQPTLDLFRKYALPFDRSTEQCVSVYVRHGDKHIEMNLVPFELYADSAKMLWENGLVVDGESSDSPFKTPVLFLGSEDAAVIEKGIIWGKSVGWKVLYTNLFDRNQVSAGLNYYLQQDLRRNNSEQHHELEYFSMLLNLHYHLQCRAFVCTQSSNFCRIIDELRATSANKANRHFVDLSCSHRPCLDKDFDLSW